MPLQRVFLGIGLAILLVMSAASIALEVESRSDAAWVNHTLAGLKKISDIRLLLRRVESAARGFALTSDPNLAAEFRDSHDQIGPAFAGLLAATRDNPAQTQSLKSIEALVIRRLAIASELIRLKSAGDNAAIVALIARAEGRAAMGSVSANFDQLAEEEERLLAERSAESRFTGRVLLVIDLAGVALILMLAVILIREAHRGSRELQTSLRATRAANESLEAAVAERTEHLLAAHEEVRHSASVLQSTFNSIAEAVLVIDSRGTIILSNPAAERLLHYRPDMTVDQLRAQNIPYRTDGSMKLADNETPAVRAMRGEQFGGEEVIVRQPDRSDPLHLVVSGGPLRDASGAGAGCSSDTDYPERGGPFRMRSGPARSVASARPQPECRGNLVGQVVLGHRSVDCDRRESECPHLGVEAVGEQALPYQEVAQGGFGVAGAVGAGCGCWRGGGSGVVVVYAYGGVRAGCAVFGGRGFADAACPAQVGGPSPTASGPGWGAGAADRAGRDIAVQRVFRCWVRSDGAGSHARDRRWEPSQGQRAQEHDDRRGDSGLRARSAVVRPSRLGRRRAPGRRHVRGSDPWAGRCPPPTRACPALGGRSPRHGPCR